jgi:hypothetical protein
MFLANIYAQKLIVDLLLLNTKQGLTKNSLNSLDEFGTNLVETNLVEKGITDKSGLMMCCMIKSGMYENKQQNQSCEMKKQK